jgi:ATP-dependent DNA helicase RecG
MNLMFEESIKEGKGTPGFTGTDDYQVAVTLHGEIQDPQFLRFLEQVGRERLATFTTQDFLTLDLVHREQHIPDELRPCLSVLSEYGIIERTGGGRYILSQKFYKFLGKKGVYTRKRGLDRETNKALLLKHIQDNQTEGSQLQDLMQVLPALSRPQVQTLLRELERSGLIHHTERTRAARWYPGHRVE